MQDLRTPTTMARTKAVNMPTLGRCTYCFQQTKKGKKCSTRGCKSRTHQKCVPHIKKHDKGSKNFLCKFCRMKETRRVEKEAARGETAESSRATIELPNNDSTPTRTTTPTNSNSSTEVGSLVITTSSTSDNCSKCNEAISATCKTIRCDECKKTIHLSCAMISSKDRIVVYYCDECELNDHSKVTLWAKTLYGCKEEDQEEVEAIIEHNEWEEQKDGKTITKREFRVRWKGYGENDDTWHDEEYLHSCLDLLQHYCKEAKIPYSEIDGSMGADTSEPAEYNEKCWVTAKQIINIVNRQKNLYTYKSELDISLFNHKFTKDEIFIVRHKSHCYVILYIKKAHQGYVADGLNLSTDYRVLDELRRRTKLNLRPLRYNLQTRRDHCGGSGACIALSLMKAYRTKLIPKKLTIAKSIRKKIMDALHKEPSKALVIRYDLKEKKTFRCHCGRKTFKHEGALKRHKQLKGCIETPTNI